uniref:Uncharacterized protein n=1 Tax=Cucumis melo TaxID=3656 RepID=A0A9I9EHT0_CUCME
SNHGQTRLLDRSNLTIIVAGRSRFYNDSTSSTKRKVGRSCGVVPINTRLRWDVRVIDRGECACKLSKQHSCPYLSSLNQILELHSQLAPDGTQPLFGNEICGMVFGRRSCYLKGLGWGLKPKARKTASASSSTTSCSQSTVELQLRAALYQAMKCIEKCLKNHDVLASEVERMRKLIEDTSPAQQGPPHDP